MIKDRCICGRQLTDHPEPQRPTPHYEVARRALIVATSRVIYWPGITEGHRRAIERARRERSEVAV